MEIKTIEQARELGLSVNTYNNGDWEYLINGYWHLFRNDKELLPEVKKVFIHLYPNGDYVYQDAKGKWHTVNLSR